MIFLAKVLTERDGSSAQTLPPREQPDFLISEISYICASKRNSKQYCEERETARTCDIFIFVFRQLLFVLSTRRNVSRLLCWFAKKKKRLENLNFLCACPGIDGKVPCFGWKEEIDGKRFCNCNLTFDDDILVCVSSFREKKSGKEPEKKVYRLPWISTQARQSRNSSPDIHLQPP